MNKLIIRMRKTKPTDEGFWLRGTQVGVFVQVGTKYSFTTSQI